MLLRVSLLVVGLMVVLVHSEESTGGPASPKSSPKAETGGMETTNNVQVDSTHVDDDDQDDEPLIKFEKKDLVRLSRAQYDTKHVPLDVGCKYLDETLFSIFKDRPEGSLDKATLFGKVIKSLAKRTTPFHTEQPYVKPFRDCVEQLSSYQMDAPAKSGTPKRTVVAGPNYAMPGPELKDPIKEMKKEFAQVKERVVDHGQDLYPPKEAVDKVDSKASTSSKVHVSGLGDKDSHEAKSRSGEQNGDHDDDHAAPTSSGLGESSAKTDATKYADEDSTHDDNDHEDESDSDHDDSPLEFSDDDIAKLSHVQEETQHLPLDQRCMLLEEALRLIFEDKPEGSLRSAHLFIEAVDSLSKKTHPSGDGNSIVKPFEECLENLSSPQSAGEHADHKDGEDSDGESGHHSGDTVYESCHGEHCDDEVHGDSHSSHGSGRKHSTMDPAVMGPIVRGEMLEEEMDREIEKERDPAKKLEKLQEKWERERERLMNRLDESRYEIEDLLQEREQRELETGKGADKSTKSVMDESRLAMMEAMHEQALKREDEANRKERELRKELAECLASKLEAGDSSSNENDDDDDDHRRARDNDDSDGDDSEDEDDDRRGKKVKSYKDSEKVARKLQDRLKSSETPESRCMKYYMVLNYPKDKVNKKVVKMVARLPLPAVTSDEPEYYESLEHFARVFSQSKNKEVRSVARELEQCLPSASASVQFGPSQDTFAKPGRPFFAPSVHHSVHKGPKHFYHEVTSTSSSGNGEVPVTIVSSSKSNKRFSSPPPFVPYGGMPATTATAYAAAHNGAASARAGFGPSFSSFGRRY